MKITNSRFFLGVLIAAAVAGLGACELVAAVDRDKIPGSDAGVAGSGGTEAGADVHVDVTSEDVVTDKPGDTKLDQQEEEDAPIATCTDNEKNGKETDVDCGGGSCPKCADTKTCTLASDCLDGVCTNKKCAAPKCDDQVKNGDETDVDCGGKCTTKCADGKGCGGDQDCTSGVCGTDKKCTAAACDDGVMNGDETDIDCGGSCTSKCTDDKGCKVDADCLNKNCASADGGALKCTAASCDDQKQDGTETDVDCGGSVCTTKCADTKKCTTSNDCVSGVCDLSQDPDVCKAPACDDSVMNGDETDVDCGGSCTKKCADTKYCKLPADCESGFCNTSLTKPVCEAATCNDGFLNGDETDLDCGGSCKKCADEQICKIANDCSSLHCGDPGDGGLACIAASCTDTIKNQGETDVDCGGSSQCQRCVDGKDCSANSDCLPNHACDSQTNKCVECVGDDNCALGKLCDTTAKTCSLSGCTSGHSCSGTLACCTGVCSDLNIDPLHCGQCGTPCSTVHVPTATCAAGQCTGACETGFANCDSDLKGTGCEVTLATDANNCGACGTICSNNNITTPVCAGSQCVGTCDTGFGDCNTDKQADGCEINTTNDPAHCGACITACTVANGTPGCAASQCTVAGCDASHADCNGTYLDGCEINIATDTAHCGTCTTTCTVAHGAAGCVAKACVIASCTAPYDDCTGGYADGCETDTSTSTGHCGSCSRACDNAHTATLTCAAGVCNSTCASGFGNCNEPAAPAADDGCETDTTTSTANCGACGRGCNNTHTAALSCAAGVCNSTCVSGFGNCGTPASPLADDGCETDINTSIANCGACARACGNTQTATISCAAGLCNSTCNNGFGNCTEPVAPLADNACETTTTNNVLHCGSCATQCTAGTNATPTCAGTTCSFSCNGTFADCNNNAGDGCEINTLNDASHCGDCLTVCPTRANSTPTCATSVCHISCNGGFADCNSDSTDGCEVTLGTDPANCGACGHVCGNSGTCVGGLCNCGGSQCTQATQVCTDASTCG